MKNTFRNILAIAAIFIGFSAFAQNYDAVKLNKTATPNGDGSYTLTLDAFVTGEAIRTQTHETYSNPLDVVLVLDVSGSMSDPLKDEMKPLATAKYKWKGLSYSLDSFDDSALDKEKGKREGYYSADVDGILVDGFRKVRYTNSDGWQVIYFGSWTKLKDVHTKTEINIYKSKLGSLMDACDAFVEKINSNDKTITNGNGHKLGVVTFASSATVVSGLVNINGNKDQLLTKIHALKADGATRVDYGFAELVTKTSKNSNKPVLELGNGRSKVVVLFTDGKPTSGTEFENSVANSAISYAKNMKDGGAKVYTINVLETEAGSNMDKYMNYVSSNYPSASSLDNAGTGTMGGKYYKQASDEDGLKDVFVEIVNDSFSESGSADIVLNKDEIVIKDIVTSSFLIPEGANSVKLYTQELDHIDATKAYADDAWRTSGYYTWKARQAAPAYVTYNIPEGSRTVNVEGFDFSLNWVGVSKFYKNGVYQTGQDIAHGSRLIIEITIVPDPNAEGGAVTTNDSNSGVYIGGENVTPVVINFPVPAPVYTPKNLVLKSGSLASGKGESMLFLITNDVDPNFKMTVALTEGGTTTQTIAQLPVKDGDKTINYTVTPLNSWSWAYGTVSAKTQNLLDNNVFEFAPGAAGSTAKHAEDSKNNVFE